MQRKVKMHTNQTSLYIYGLHNARFHHQPQHLTHQTASSNLIKRLRKMKTHTLHDQEEQVLGIPISSAASNSHLFERKPRRQLLIEQAFDNYVPTPANQSLTVKQNKVDTVLKRLNRLGQKADKFANGIREHVRLGAKMTETLKGKLSLGAKILQVGGVKKAFRQLFSISEGERLLKASQCYVSTSAGPIAGLLFISTHKLAFCSERLIKLTSPQGKFLTVHYKVVIPVSKIKTANQSENVKKPSQKYLEIETVDKFDFWFMGFLNYKKTFQFIQLAIFQAQINTNDQM